MRGCCSLDLAQETLGADHGGQFGAEDLDGDAAVVLQVVGEVDGGHAAGAELALEAVAVGQGVGQAAERIGHGGRHGGTSEIAPRSALAWSSSGFKSVSHSCQSARNAA
jgi:hypothetical protein